MKYKVLVIGLFISGMVVNTHAQGGLLTSDFNMVGLKRIFTNLQGNLAPEGVVFSEQNSKELNAYSADYTFGISFETLNHFKRNRRWMFIGEVGLYSVSGSLDSKVLLDSRVVQNGSYYRRVRERQTDFNSIYLFAGTKIGYDILPNSNLTLIFGPKMAGRVKNRVTTDNYFYIYENEFNPDFDFYKGSNTHDEDDDLVPLQLFFSFGIYKSFTFKEHIIFVGLDYDRSFLNIHNNGNLKSHLLSLSVKYAWAKNRD